MALLLLLERRGSSWWCIPVVLPTGLGGQHPRGHTMTVRSATSRCSGAGQAPQRHRHRHGCIKCKQQTKLTHPTGWTNRRTNEGRPARRPMRCARHHDPLSTRVVVCVVSVSPSHQDDAIPCRWIPPLSTFDGCHHNGKKNICSFVSSIQLSHYGLSISTTKIFSLAPGSSFLVFGLGCSHSNSIITCWIVAAVVFLPRGSRTNRLGDTIFTLQ